jgi:hypothetical protein
MGVPVSNPGSNRDNCPKISTSCVIWQGPDIPCIDLCAGDAVDEVVFKLATYLCELSENIFNINNIDFQCLTPLGTENENIPTNLEELIQLMINYSCGVIPFSEFSASAPALMFSAKTVGTLSTGEPLLELPDGLAYFDENGDYITVLEQSKYIEVVSAKLVETIKQLNLNNGRLFTAEKAIKNLETQFDSFISSSTSDIYVVSQCASNGIPGQQILIQDAFTVFERTYCNLASVIGSTTSLFRAISSQIPNLPNLPQLMNGGLQMKALPRWSVTVNDIGTSLSNLWLTVNDMRSKIIEIANNTFDVPCILLSPEDVTVGTITTSLAQIYWEKPSISNVQMPTSYVVEVFETSDTTFQNPIFSITSLEKGIPNVAYVGNLSILPEVIYVVHVSSIYKCGISNPISLLTKLKTSDTFFEVNANIDDLAPIPMVCTDSDDVETNYDLIRKTISFDLYNIAGAIPAVNGTNIPITIIARFSVESCDFSEPIHEDVTFQIQPGNGSSNTYTFVSEKLTNCTDGACGPYSKELLCGVFVSDPTIQFDSTYGVCD